MQMNPHLSFNGQCKAAFKFYEKCLGGKIQTMLAHEGTPIAQHVPAEWRSKILHATMIVDGHVLMGADAPPWPISQAGRLRHDHWAQ
jgi:PhnB protein